MPKLKLPKRTDGGCTTALGNTIVCKPTTTGILKPSHMKLIGNGLVTIPANIARVIPTMFENLKPDHMLASAGTVSELVKKLLCSWCDGLGWQGVNCYEDVVACAHCSGSGLEPVLKDGRTCGHKNRSTVSGTWKDKHVVIPKCLDCGWIRPSAKRWIRIPKDPDAKK